ATAVHCVVPRCAGGRGGVLSDHVWLRTRVRRSASNVLARRVRIAFQSARIVPAKPARRNLCSHLARCIRWIDCRVPSCASYFVTRGKRGRSHPEKIVASFSTPLSFFS